MQITAEEELMYGVMKAIYESGIPIDFKGSMEMAAWLAQVQWFLESFLLVA